MLSDLTHLAREARESIEIPPFPAYAIRTAAQHQPRVPRRRSAAATALAVLSLAGIAAAAALHGTHLTFTHSGGLVIASNVQNGSVAIHDDAPVRAAAQKLDFTAILPAGLPKGTKPAQLYTAGRSLMAVTYDLPGAQRASHHLLWIFLADPAIVSGSPSRAPKYGWRTGKSMIASHWRIGPEEVIVVSNGLTQSERAAIKSAMEREAH